MAGRPICCYSPAPTCLRYVGGGFAARPLVGFSTQQPDVPSFLTQNPQNKHSPSCNRCRPCGVLQASCSHPRTLLSIRHPTRGRAAIRQTHPFLCHLETLTPQANKWLCLERTLDLLCCLQTGHPKSANCSASHHHFPGSQLIPREGPAIDMLVGDRGMV